MQFHAFDASYVDNLRAGDYATQDHFVRYFTELLHLKLRSRLRSPQAIEDVRQETFARVFASLKKGGAIRQPDRLGAFVNTVCNNVLFEHYRSSSRSESLDDEGQPELPATGLDALGHVAAQQRQVLLGLAQAHPRAAAELVREVRRVAREEYVRKEVLGDSSNHLHYR